MQTYLQTSVIGAEKNGENIKNVYTSGKFGPLSFSAEVYVDATGDGDLAVQSGCRYEMGREGDGLVQPVTLMFVIDGVDSRQPLLCRHEEDYTDLGDGREYLDLCHKACRTGELPENVNIVRLYATGVNTERMVNATQENRIDPLDPMDVFKAEASLRRQIGKIVDFLKNNIPGFEDIHIKGSASTLGVRESRRILGRYQLTEQDLMEGRTYPDSVVHKANFCLDIHNPSGAGQAVHEERRPVTPKPYDIHSAITMSSVAILAHRSVLNGGASYDIPDFRTEEDRVQYENDNDTPFYYSDGRKPTIPCCSVHDYAPTEDQLRRFDEMINS